MPAYTIAQMVAVISADSTEFKQRLEKVEAQLKSVQVTSDTTSNIIQDGYVKVAKSIKTVEQEQAELQKAIANRAEYEYRTNQKSAADYKVLLSQRMTAFEEYQNEWRQAALRLAQIEIAEQNTVTNNLKAQMLIRENLHKANLYERGASKSVVIANDILNNENRLTDPKFSIEEQIRASENLVQLHRQQKAEEVRLEKTAAEERIRALSNVAKFEYEQGTLSLAAYKAFLEQKMSSYAAYSTQWKAASSELLSIERAQLAEREAQDKAYLSTRLAEMKAEREAEVAVNKEVNAMMSMDNKAFVASIGAEAKRISDIHNEQAKGKGGGLGSIGTGLGNVAAAITGIEVATGLMAGKLDHSLVGIANNANLTNKEFQQMRENTLKLGQETGQPFEDIAKGYQKMIDYGYKGADATKILTEANKEAVAVMGSTESIAGTLAASIHIFGASANDASKYMNILHRAAGESSVTIQEFVDNAGPALAIAAGFKIKFADAVASISALSRAGFNAAEAATQVKGIVSHMADPAAETTKIIVALQKLTGIPLVEDFSAKGLATKGLMGVFQDLHKAVGNNADVVLKLIPALRGGVGAMTLLNTASEDYKKTLAELNGITNESTGVNDSFNRMMDDNLQRWKKLSNTIQTEFLPTGEKALEILTKWQPAIKGTADSVLLLTNMFQSLPDWIQQTVTVIGGLVILNKFTGLLTALQIPVVFKAGLQFLVGILPKVSVVWAGLTTSVTLANTAQNVASISTLTLGARLLAFGAVAGPIAIVVGALAIMVASIWRTIDGFNEMKKSEEEAKQSLQDFADMKDRLSKGTERDKYTLDLLNKSYEIDELKDKLDGLKTTNQIFGGQEAEINSTTKALKNLNEEYKNIKDAQVAYTSIHKKDQTLGGVTNGNNNVMDAALGTFLGVQSGGISQERLEAYMEEQKLLEAQRKEHEKALKAAQQRYAHEIFALREIIALHKKVQDLSRTDEQDKALLALSKGGPLELITDRLQKQRLMLLAKQADDIEHLNKLKDMIDSVEARTVIAGQPYLKQKAIEFLGGGRTGLDNWRQLGTIGEHTANQLSDAQKKVLDSVKKWSIEDETKRQQKALEQLAFSQRIAGDSVKKAAVEAAGGMLHWKSLSAAQQENGLYVQKQVMYYDELSKMVEHYRDKVKETAPAVKTISQEAQIDIDATKAKLGGLIPLTKAWFDALHQIQQIKDYAAAADRNNADNWMKKEQEQLALENKRQRDTLLRNSLPRGTEDRGQIAVDAWREQNQKEIEKFKATYGWFGPAILKSFEDRIRAEAKEQQQVENLLGAYSKAGGALEDSMKQALALRSSDPFQQWLNSYMELQKVVDSNGKVTYKLGLPDGTDVGLMREVYNQIRGIAYELKYLDMLHQATEGLAGSIVNGIKQGISPDANTLGSLQTQRLTLKDQLRQFQVAQAEFKNKYPSDPNDPYIQRIKELQKEIDKTDHQISAMGNHIDKTFMRIFKGIIQGFEDVAQKIAEDYLRAELLRYLTRQIGVPSIAGTEGSRPSMTGGGGRTTGSIVDAINFGIQFIPFLHGGGGSNVNSLGASTYNDYPVAAKGGRAVPGLPTWVGDGGEPELIVPSAPGWIIPRHRMGTSGSSGGETTINNFKQIINTPDVQSFRSSRRTQMEGAHRFFNSNKRR